MRLIARLQKSHPQDQWLRGNRRWIITPLPNRLAILQARREKLRADLEREGGPSVPLYNRERARSPSLTLGKAAPLTEKVSVPVAENVRSWSEKLPAVQQQLIYPDRRALKGEGAVTATTGDVVSTTSDRGSREQAYRPPEERGGMKSKTKDEGVNAQVQPQGMRRGGGGGQSSQATRLGLLLPTLIVGIYVLYVAIRWQSLMGENELMYGLHWSESLSLVLFWVVCAIAGALILMQRLSTICRYEKQFGLSGVQLAWCDNRWIERRWCGEYWYLFLFFCASSRELGRVDGAFGLCARFGQFGSASGRVYSFLATVGCRRCGNR